LKHENVRDRSLRLMQLLVSMMSESYMIVWLSCE